MRIFREVNVFLPKVIRVFGALQGACVILKARPIRRWKRNPALWARVSAVVIETGTLRDEAQAGRNRRDCTSSTAVA